MNGTDRLLPKFSMSKGQKVQEVQKKEGKNRCNSKEEKNIVD
jgi:hypothetical protein